MGNQAGAVAEAERLAARGRACQEAGDSGEALSLYLDAARAYSAAGDGKSARHFAGEVLYLWPTFEASKQLVVRRAATGRGSTPSKPRLRRLPRVGEAAPALVEQAVDEAGPVTSLPSIFIEMHAEALALAGDERASKARLVEAQDAVFAEVSRRLDAQEWSEAFSAGLSWVRLAKAAGRAEPLQKTRRAFIALAREAAHEALTAEYFARGKDDLPIAALRAAEAEARLLGDEPTLRELEADRTEVASRCADLLEQLSDERTAAEAILSWEDSWPYLSKQPGLRKALLELPSLAASLAGPFSALASMAETHPARAEVREFAERHTELVARARERLLALRQAPAAQGR